MSCHIGTNLIVCGPPRGVYHRRIDALPCCGRRRRCIVRWDGAWYGTTWYCACGDSFADGEMYPRPFQRGWRKKAQDKFRAMWANAAPRALYDAYTDADVRMAIGSDGEWEQAAVERDAALDAIQEARAA